MNKIFLNKKIENIGKRNMSAGFTIIETLVAIAILVLSITGPMVIISQSLKSAYFARDQVTAFYLAQEAIEYIRNTRDSNIFNGSTDWLTSIGTNDDSSFCGLNPSGTNNYSCGLSRTTSGYALAPCDNNGALCPPLNFDSSTGIFGDTSSSAAPSPFSRTIYLMKLPEINNPGGVDGAGYPLASQILVKVVITWTSSVGRPNTFVLNELLTNWGS